MLLKFFAAAHCKSAANIIPLTTTILQTQESQFSSAPVNHNIRAY
jgi:hypothetical protein